jgi:hypothetical protein
MMRVVFLIFYFQGDTSFSTFYILEQNFFQTILKTNFCMSLVEMQTGKKQETKYSGGYSIVWVGRFDCFVIDLFPNLLKH